MEDPCLQEFAFQTVRPLVDMRLRSQGLDYPPEIPLNITIVLELDTISKLERKCSHPDSTFVNVRFLCASNF